MLQVPSRIDANSLPWFYGQHRLLWTWVAGLSRADLVHIISLRPTYAPDYAIKAAWPGWGDRWGAMYASFACEVGGNTAKRCFKCPLGSDYCQLKSSGYQKFLASIKSGDLDVFRAAALEIRDAWPKPSVNYGMQGW